MKPHVRVVSPALHELATLRTPLEPGERRVLEFFTEHLPLEWEIYIQPHLNGLRPDFVLLHPRIGIAVFEVKNWDLSAMAYRVDTEQETPQLMANDGRREFGMAAQDPVRRIRFYKQMMEELFCPRMNKSAAGALITAGIIFTGADTEATEALLLPLLNHFKMRNDKAVRYYPVSGHDALDKGDLERVFPESLRRSSRVMQPEYAEDLRNWLVEPSVSSEQRHPLRTQMDRRQTELATTRTNSGYRRIKGPAGSGKSLVLAARAGKLVEERKDVLIVTYNITLLHYLQDLAVRWSEQSRRARKVATWWNFHLWCKYVCFEAGQGEEYAGVWRDFVLSSEGLPPGEKDAALDDFLTNTLPLFVSGVLDEAGENVFKYDAVLVDEGQDYDPKWWNLLRRVVKPGGEMVLVADSTQDIYGTATRWTDKSLAGLNTGFIGGWTELSVSYRVPVAFMPYVRAYASEFIPDELRSLPNPQPELPNAFPCYPRWVQVLKGDPALTCCKEIVRLLKRHADGALSVADVVFLSPRISEGLSVVTRLCKQYKYEFAHTFSGNHDEGRQLKHAFFLGDARLKATTIHSFKGYEARAIVVLIDDCPVQPMRQLLYVALTRLKEDTKGSYMTVVCADESLSAYGKTWPEFSEVKEEPAPPRNADDSTNQPAAVPDSALVSELAANLPFHEEQGEGHVRTAIQHRR